jgi:pimeloyl-ACP methyl ester carboxylesterase
MPGEKVFEGSAVRLNYLDYGSPSGEPLVMLHGGAWCWQEYLSLIPSLGQRWRVYALDLRGNGKSGWTPDTYRLLDFTHDNVEFLDRLSAAAVLVGHSLGGVIALMVAALRPDKVRALIIEDAPLTLDCYRHIVESSRETFGQWLGLKRSAQSERDLALKLADTYKTYPGVTSAWLMFFAGCLWRLDPTFFGALLDDFGAFSEGYDYKEIFARIDCPVMFLRGESRLGAVIPDDELFWLEQSFSNVKCRRIEGVGHLLHLEDHGQMAVLTEMMAFLESL